MLNGKLAPDDNRGIALVKEKITKLEGKRVLVVGLGKSGRAAAEFVHSRGGKVTLGDEKPLALMPDATVFATHLGLGFEHLSESTKPEFDLLIQSPGVPLEKPYFENARKAGVKIVGEVELAAPFLRGPVIGITGSNGKTTTTTWAAKMMEASGVPCQSGGNLGRPVTDMVATSRDDQWNLLELSSFQLETVETFQARIAAILNLTANHMDRHHTMEAYVAAKARLLQTQSRNSYAVLNCKSEMAREVKGELVRFNAFGPVEKGAGLEDGWITWNGFRIVEAATLGIPGRHNVENCMAAMAVVMLAGGNAEGVAKAAREFHGVEHRIEFVRERRGVKYYNDSKSTTAEATMTALSAFENGVWLILGGSDKGLDYTSLVLAGPRITKVLLIGRIAESLNSQLGQHMPVEICSTLATAVEIASHNAQRGETVLLSPGTASYDQFTNYEERGRAFKQLVTAMED